ncbi:MAG: HNH endonuclease [Anaerolineales bacterium]|nr:HNH endonuclease [Anaerolineales bacterium]
MSDELREFVIERAHNRCEYGLMPQAFSLHKHEPDHIVPRQHGGESTKENLALACMRCNRHKGPNVGSFDPDSGNLVPFFNPRTQSWHEHFSFEDGQIQPLTPEARVTEKIFKLNDDSRVAERQRLYELGFIG